jgi:hypothetical protein
MSWAKLSHNHDYTFWRRRAGVDEKRRIKWQGTDVALGFDDLDGY